MFNTEIFLRGREIFVTPASVAVQLESWTLLTAHGVNSGQYRGITAI